jgi:hypothetical protein
VGLLEESIDVLQEVEQGLAALQRDEVVVKRVGTIIVLIGILALGGMVAIGAGLAIIRRRQHVPPQSNERLDADDPTTLSMADGAAATPEGHGIDG